MPDETLNFAARRTEMVKTQLVARGISDLSVIKAMQTVPRHLFVSHAKQNLAYFDAPLKIEEEQTISQPYMVALMAELLYPSLNESVLEIGTGSGYSAAVLSRVFGKVYTIERHRILAEKAQERFNKLGYNNIEVLIGDGTKGWPEKAPFNAILVTAGGPKIPQALKEQLVVGGRMVLPVGTERNLQRLMRLTREDENRYSEEILSEVRFVPLIGEEGWEIN